VLVVMCVCGCDAVACYCVVGADARVWGSRFAYETLGEREDSRGKSR
jgi:hypothetical protein